ncbi:MAG: iron-sulfur cluster assembly accessory protein [Chlamydiia bacterium]|nr:iron-sulfur cluster assembly accessory protein [Chlamydiia bacterium]
MSTTQQEKKITREMTIDSIFTEFPHKAQKLASTLTKAGLHCVGCSAATWETLESGVLGHGMQEADLERLINNLNAVLAEVVDLGTITVTQRAAEKFITICKAEGKEGYGLRFGEKPAGCSGFEHVLGFSEKAEANDTVISTHGIQVHISKNVYPNLCGSEIDYVDGLEPGFKVSNPNAKSSCGCGNSYGY